MLAMEKITVADNDGDGALTINDALYAAHEKAFTGGAAAGYASVQSDWGLSLSKLWGIAKSPGTSCDNFEGRMLFRNVC